jgi:hypothetical protein
MKSLYTLCFILAGGVALAALPAQAGTPETQAIKADPAAVTPVCSAAEPRSSSVPDLMNAPAVASRSQTACHWAFLEDIYPDESREPGTECGTYNSCTREIEGCSTPYRSSWKEIFYCCS